MAMSAAVRAQRRRDHVERQAISRTRSSLPRPRRSVFTARQTRPCPGPFSMKLRIPVRASSVANKPAKFSRSISRPESRSTSRPWSMACLAARSATPGPPHSGPPAAALPGRPRHPGRPGPARPMASASAAATNRPVNTMSLALAGPISRGSRWVPPAPGMTPSRISGWPTRAPSPGDPEVGAQRKLKAAAERVPGDRRHHRLGDLRDRGERILQPPAPAAIAA